MPLAEGLYHIRFHTRLGEGSGAAYLHDGQVHGGDTTMAYVGSYSLDGDNIKAEIKTFPYNNKLSGNSVFGVDRAVINLEGKRYGNLIDLEGSSEQAPGVKMRAAMEYIDD
ncbi:hypothetical protein J2D73_17185 [Acetobacter sacchari]|uniref:T3SS negative regulator,GrlR n=1 Tax=Acetobacter sacchari TaxID=2661687 RepID=A0ABS3M024_9PROT|nr:GrlR family regulatory protein [Acetobacter sacchari]MBO1361522.1 hypothetical protein [Acetobacter sacchari]